MLLFLGEYKTLFREENWQHLKIENGRLKLKSGEEAFGLTTVKLLAKPEEMIFPEYPFVGFKVMIGGKEQSSYSLCFSCAKNGNSEYCTHSEAQRAFVVNRPIHFVNEAVFWGYSIGNIQ